MSDFDKKQFVDSLYSAYVTKYMNTNVVCHIEFFNMFREINKERSEKTIMEKYKKIKRLLYDNEFKQAPRLVPHTDYDMLISRFSREWPLLTSLKETINPRPYAVLNVLYTYLIQRENIEDAYSCVQYLVTLKPKEFSSAKQEVTALAIVFNLMAYVSKLLDAKFLYKYTVVSRELLYWKSTKKNLMDRIENSYLLTTTLHLIISGDIDTSKPVMQTSSGIVEKNRYLFVLCEKDWYAAQVIDEERSIRQNKTKIAVKNIKVPYQQSAASKVDILKQ